METTASVSKAKILPSACFRLERDDIGLSQTDNPSNVL